MPDNDPVNSPAHYTHYRGMEIIDLTSQMNFCRGNAVKYIARAGLKSQNTEIEDLEKAIKYLKMEINRLKGRPISATDDQEQEIKLRNCSRCNHFVEAHPYNGSCCWVPECTCEGYQT